MEDAADAAAAANMTIEVAQITVKKLLLQRQLTESQAPIRVICHCVDQADLHLSPFLSFPLSLGTGSQNFRWLSLAVATRVRLLSSKQGAVRTRDNSEVSGFYLPSSISKGSAAGVAAPLQFKPTDLLRLYVRDGDSLFFTMTMTPPMDEGGSVVHSAWQHAAFLRSDNALRRRVSEAETQRKVARLAERLRALEAGTLPPPQDLLQKGAVSPPTPSGVSTPAFGRRGGSSSNNQASTASLPGAGAAAVPAQQPPAAPGARQGPPFPQTSRSTSPSGRRRVAAALPCDPAAAAAFVTPMLGTINAAGGSARGGAGDAAGATAADFLGGGGPDDQLFGRDWARLQAPALLPTDREREALRAVLHKAHGQLRDLFAHYATLNVSAGMRAAAAAAQPPTGGDRRSSASSPFASVRPSGSSASLAPLTPSGSAAALLAPPSRGAAVAAAPPAPPQPTVSAVELDILLKDCRLLNSITQPYLSPVVLCGAVANGRLLAEAAQAGGSSDALDAAVALYAAGGVDSSAAGVVGTFTSPPLRRAVHQLQAAQQNNRGGVIAAGRRLSDAQASQPGRATPAGGSTLSHAGRALTVGTGGPVDSAASAPQPLPIAATMAVLAGVELDRPAFIDALVLGACSLWECCRGGPVPAPPSSSDGASSGGGASGGSGGGHSHGHGGGGGGLGGPQSPRGMNAAPHNFGGSAAAAAVASSAAGGSGVTPSSLAAGRLPALRAHMVASFLSQSVLPRLRRFQTSGASTPIARRELLAKKAAAQVLRELPVLKAAFGHYGHGREAGLSLGQWVRMLVDCSLATRPSAAAATTAAPAGPAAPAASNRLSMAGLGAGLGAAAGVSSSRLSVADQLLAQEDALGGGGSGIGGDDGRASLLSLGDAGGGGTAAPTVVAATARASVASVSSAPAPVPAPPGPVRPSGLDDMSGRTLLDVDAAHIYLLSIADDDSAAVTAAFTPAAAKELLLRALPPKQRAAAASSSVAKTTARSPSRGTRPAGGLGAAGATANAAASSAAAAASPAAPAPDAAATVPASGVTSAAAGLPPHAGLDGGLTFSEWLEALMRVALFKWNDAAMAGSEKLARVIDAIAVRLSTLGVDTDAFDGGKDPLLRAAAQRVAAVEKAANAARIAARVGLMAGGGGGAAAK